MTHAELCPSCELPAPAPAPAQRPLMSVVTALLSRLPRRAETLDPERTSRYLLRDLGLLE